MVAFTAFSRRGILFSFPPSLVGCASLSERLPLGGALRLGLARYQKSVCTAPFGASDQQKPIFRARRERAGRGTFCVRASITHHHSSPIMLPDDGQSRRDLRIRGLDIDRRFGACMRACVGAWLVVIFSLSFLDSRPVVTFRHDRELCVALIDLRHCSRGARNDS